MSSACSARMPSGGQGLPHHTHKCSAELTVKYFPNVCAAALHPVALSRSPSTSKTHLTSRHCQCLIRSFSVQQRPTCLQHKAQPSHPAKQRWGMMDDQAKWEGTWMPLGRESPPPQAQSVHLQRLNQPTLGGGRENQDQEPLRTAI